MSDKTLFSICPDGEFFGRQKELDYVFSRASEAHKAAPSIFIAGRRWTGKTELLRRTHRDLFWGQARVAPVYYQFKGYGSADFFAEDYLKEVLKQYLAFRRRENGLVRAELSLDKLERLLIDNDAFGLAEIITRHREARKGSDHAALLRNAIGAPRAITRLSGIPVYLILDDLELASSIRFFDGGPGILKEFMEALSGPQSFLAASATKKALEGGVLNGSVEVLALQGLEEGLAAGMMMDLCSQYGLEFDSEVLSLAAVKLEGNPMYMKNVIWAAHRMNGGLMDLRGFAGIYSSEISEGNTALSLRSSISLKGLGDLRILSVCAGLSEGAHISDEELEERLKLGHAELRRSVEGLAAAGLLEYNLGSIRWAGDGVVRDFISFVYETRVKGRSAEEVKTSIVRECLKQGFTARGAKVGGKLKDSVSGLLRSFNGQKVSKVLFSHQGFSARPSKDAPKMVGDKKQEDELILPQVIGCYDSARWEKNEAGPPVVLANGFQNGRYDSGNEVVWITGVKDGMTPVNLGDVENFLRRSLILRENFRTARVVRWMTGKEGFTAEAQKRLEAESVFSADSLQLRAIRQCLEEKAAGRPRGAGRFMPDKEFEVVLPSSTKAELVAARAVEEIGTEMGFGEDSIAQIKAALVEACINAFEHGRVRDAKVFLRFVASSDRLSIYVQNAGADFDAPAAEGARPGGAGALPHRRGWGLELMKGLMDEVRFETLRGGARIVLVKYLIKKGEADDGKEA